MARITDDRAARRARKLAGLARSPNLLLSIGDQRVAKALSHPLRGRILGLLDGEELSPSDIAKATGEKLTNVVYHVNTLVDLGLIELVGTTPRRGAVEHHYRAVERPSSGWQRLPSTVRKGVAGQIVDQLFAEVRAAVERGGFSHEAVEMHLVELELTDAEWAALARTIHDLVEHAEKNSALSARGSAPPRTRARLGVMLFDSGEAPGS